MTAPNSVPKTARTPKPTKAPAALPTGETWAEVLRLLAQYAEATHALLTLKVELTGYQLCHIDRARPRYGALQEAQQLAEAQLRALALSHPEWFAERKNLPTPFGQLKLTTATALEPTLSEEVSLALLEAAGRTEFIRVTKTLDKEALEKLDPAELAQYRLAFVTTTDIKITPAEVNLGQAFKTDPAPPAPVA